MTDAAEPERAREGAPAGLPSVGQPLEGTDARPSDPLPDPNARPADADEQGGDNPFQDELRAHAAAQGSDGQLRRGLDDRRASDDLGSMNDNGDL